jgi:flagellin
VGFTINTNINAMNALRNLQLTGSEYSKSVTRLSNGLRITSGADDPAGLVISENFKAQIVGVDQAVRNAQDAASYAKTAEGALGEVNQLLRDARALAVASGNTGVLDTASLQANQTQITSIISSIDRIAKQTQFGGKQLLDGSSGVSASVTDTGTLAGITLGGTFGGYAVQTNGVVTVALKQAATRATKDLDVSYTSMSSVVSSGTMVLNGVSITTDGTETLQQVINKINLKAGLTGVTANATTADGSTVVTLNQTQYGSNNSITLYDTGHLLYNAAASVTATARDATVSVTVATTNGATTVAFTGGRSSGDSGLRLTDTYGNVLLLSEAGNSTLTSTAIAAAQVTAGSASFQIGANAGNTTSLALSNVYSSNLGTTAVAGKSFGTIDITTSAGADEALKIIDAAISQVSNLRGNIGSFQKNVVESSIRSLGVAKENLSATESQITDLDVASEITNFTKLQILQQSGLSVLAQANAAPQSVLKLLQ